MWREGPKSRFRELEDDSHNGCRTDNVMRETEVPRVLGAGGDTPRGQEAAPGSGLPCEAFSVLVVSAGRPAAARVAGGDRPLLVVHAEGAAPAVLDGVRMPPGVMVAVPAGEACWLRATGPGRGMAVAAREDESVAAAMAGGAEVRALLAGAAMRRVLVRAVDGLAGGGGASEDEVRAAVAVCLAAPPVRRMASPARRALLARFERMVAEAPPRGLAVEEVAARLQVAGRTLRSCVSDFVGMGPARHINRQRLLRVHEALLRARPGQDRVTELAMRHGFSELGRFSVAYRAMFGEPPSATLGRPAEAPRMGAPAAGVASLLPLGG